jgi:hypothetical protein
MTGEFESTAQSTNLFGLGQVFAAISRIDANSNIEKIRIIGNIEICHG